MISSVAGSRCAECSGEVLDLGDELVCGGCGVARGKEVAEAAPAGSMRAIDFTGQSLGGYLGPPEPSTARTSSVGLACSASNYKYLKLVSDYSGRENSTFYGCAKMIERVAEKFSLPGIVVGQAVTLARALYANGKVRPGITAAAVSAYSISTACKVLGVSSVTVKETVEAHRLLGRRVTISSLISLSLESPYRTNPRKPEDYVGKIVARLESLSGPVASLVQQKVNPSEYFHGLRFAATKALERVGEEERGGHSPCSLAATAVYAGEVGLARLGLRRRVFTQREAAVCAGVAEYTVRELYGRLFRVFSQPPYGPRPVQTQIRPR